MSSKATFKKLRRKTYLAYHQDGIIDLIIGLSILGFSLNMATDNSAFLFMGWIWIVFYMPLKNRITFPRLGFAKFDNERTTRTGLLLMMMVGIITLALFVGLFVFVRSDAMSPALSAWLRQYHLLVLGAFLAVAMVIAALFSGIKRLFVYAAVTMLSIFLGIQLGVAPPIFTLVLGGLIGLSGAWLLLRFVRRYPIVADDDVKQ